jgi:hypothetical protein
MPDTLHVDLGSSDLSSGGQAPVATKMSINLQ